MNISVRRRLMAPVAAIGVAIAMSVTAPLGPAYANVIASAGVNCAFDIDGSAANVQSIDLTGALSIGIPIVDIKNVVTSGIFFANVDTSSAPCRNGVWTSSASASVTFPAGYSPQTDFGTTSESKTINFGDCPNDYVVVPDVIGETLANAQIDLHNARR